MQHTHHRTALTALACAAALALAACDNRSEEQTAGQKVDAAIATVEQKADAVGAEVREGVAAARDGAATAIDSASDAARDAAITTQIHADLARDPELSTLKIDVDTTDGKVVLTGTAPTDAARDRAAAKALAVAGVTAVDNRLRVGS